MTDVGVAVTNLRVVLVCKTITCVSAKYLYSHNQYIKIFVVRLCVTNVGVAVTNLRVVCKTITCVSAFTEIAILLFFLVMIVEAAAGLDTLRCRLRERCHCGRLPLH